MPEGSPSDRAHALAETQLAQLHRLAEIGLDLADALKRDVQGAGRLAEKERALLEAGQHDVLISACVVPIFAGDISQIFARISRAVRMTLALQSRIMRGLERFERNGRDGEPSQRTRRPVSAATSTESPDAEPGERLLDHDDMPDLLTRPFADVLAQICQDLALSLPPVGVQTGDIRDRCAETSVTHFRSRWGGRRCHSREFLRWIASLNLFAWRVWRGPTGGSCSGVSG